MNYNRIDNKESFNIKIPWDRNTYLGFFISAVLSILVVLIASMFNLHQPTLYEPKSNVIPIELLIFGEGDGTGMSKGNLTEEGEAHKGKLPANQLEDAKIAATGKVSSNSKLIRKMRMLFHQKVLHLPINLTQMHRVAIEKTLVIRRVANWEKV